MFFTFNCAVMFFNTQVQEEISHDLYCVIISTGSHFVNGSLMARKKVLHSTCQRKETALKG